MREKNKDRKKELLASVQAFIPVKDIRGGVIETTDYRFIRILEIEPINFMLRSAEEQNSIISTFAGWLKISPIRLQFKSLTRKADSDHHIAMIRKDLEKEKSEKCREVGEDYIRLISDIGNREALTRRFFLIFEYESVHRNTDDLSKIYGMLQTAEQNARAYGAFGITHDNDSLYEDKNATPPKMKVMPVLGDLHKNLLGNPMTERIAVILSRFVTGSAQSFNWQTNVNLDNDYVVLDLSDLKEKLLLVGMMIALDYVWDKIKSVIIKKKAIMIDEIWQLVGATSNRLAAEFCLTIFKTIRGFGGIAVSATQDLSDFFGLDDGKYRRAIINSSQNKIVLNLEPDEAKYVQDVLKPTKTEIDSITRFERGEALICSGVNKVPVSIKAFPAEHELITTDRSEPESLMRKRHSIASE